MYKAENMNGRRNIFTVSFAPRCTQMLTPLQRDIWPSSSVERSTIFFNIVQNQQNTFTISNSNCRNQLPLVMGRFSSFGDI